MKKLAVIVVVAVLTLAGVGTWLLMSKSSVADRKESAALSSEENETSVPAKGKSLSSPRAGVGSPAVESSGGDAVSSQPEESQTDEEKAEAAAEAKVEAFDNLTDKWMEPAKTGVSMKDVDGFISTFRQVPKDRQDECIHRALNLIPDENVMLLVGVLMDKTMDKEVVETVFNDVLNRDEDVKKPILQQVFKDKTHPCWADTAWILDVTGEAPVKQTP